MINDSLTLLRGHSSTQGLDETELKFVADHSNVVNFAHDDVLYQAGNSVSDLCLIVHGRFRVSITEAGGNERLIRYLGAGFQFGVLAILGEQVQPFNVKAEEPSRVLKISSNDLKQLMEGVPLFRRNLLRQAGLLVSDTIISKQLSTQPRIIGFLHASSETRPVVKSLIRRLSELNETIGLMSDDLTLVSSDVLTRSLKNQSGDLIPPDEARHQIGQWSHCNRILIELEHRRDNNSEFERIIEGMGMVDKVFFLATKSNHETIKHIINRLVNHIPAWQSKIDLIWFYPDEDAIAPVGKELVELSNRDFKVKISECHPKGSSQKISGIERIVHYLRGVQLGIALGGGAARGMAHIGVLKALERAGICFDLYAGTSSGAMVGIVYASGRDSDYMVKHFTEDLQLNRLFRITPGGGKWFMLSKYRSGAWDGMLRKYLTDFRLEQFHIPMQAVTVDLIKAREVVRDCGDAVHAILESINLPLLSKPIMRDGMALVDGGVINTLPANVLVRSGATFVLAVNVSSEIKHEFAGNTSNTPPAEMKSPSDWQTLLRTLSVQDKNLSSIGASSADFTISPDVSEFDISEFTRTPEIAAIGQAAAEQAIPELQRILNKIDAELFPIREIPNS